MRPGASAASALAPRRGKDRLFANPARPKARAAGGEVQLAEDGYRPQAGAALKLNQRDYVAQAACTRARA